MQIWLTKHDKELDELEIDLLDFKYRTSYYNSGKKGDRGKQGIRERTTLSQGRVRAYSTSRNG